jgi:RimJ/RimL family protein N-acetyltransferase
LAVKVEPPNPPLADDLIALRELSPDDAAAVAAACVDHEILRWTRTPTDYTLRHALDWIAATEAGWDTGRADLAITEQASAAFVGAIGLVVLTPWLGEIGFWVAAPFRGRGYMTRALRLVTSWGHSLGLTRLQLEVFVGNSASERVAAKVGYRPEGELRSYAEQRGELRDVTLWAHISANTLRRPPRAHA